MASHSLLAESHGPPLDPDPTSLWDVLREQAAKSPESIALISSHQPPKLLEELEPLSSLTASIDDSSTWTYARLLNASEKLARKLLGHGLQSGDTFAAFLPNVAEWFVMFWACARLEVAFAPIDPAFLERPIELRHILKTLSPKAVVCLDGRHTIMLNATLDVTCGQAAIRIVLRQTPPAAVGWISLTAIASCSDPVGMLPDVATRPHAPFNCVALILMTSGTTDLPKACLHTPRNLHAESDCYRDILRIRSHHRFLTLGPLFHIYALWMALVAFRAGASICLPSPRFDPGEAAKNLQRLRCTHLGCSPTTALALLMHPGVSEHEYGHVSSLRLGGDGIPQDLVTLCKKTLNPQKIYLGWGMTESIGAITQDGRKKPAWHDQEYNIGFVTPGNSARVCIPGSAEVVERGKIGELHIAGPAVMLGYLEGSDSSRSKTLSSFHRTGERDWFATGDLVRMQDDGELWICGRLKDMIIRGGENISPKAMESCLNETCGIETQVIGIQDPVAGQTPVAVITTKLDGHMRAGLEQRMQRQIQDRFGRTHRLAGIVTLHELGFDHLPMTAIGKVQKSILREAMEVLLSKKTVPSSKSTMTLDIVLATWQRVLTTTAISPDTSVKTLADSLLMLRFCYEIERILQKSLTVADVLENETPLAQARLLDHFDGRALVHQKFDREAWEAQARSSKRDHSILTVGVQFAIEQCAKDLGVSWPEDMEGVYEPHEGMDIFASSNARPSACNLQWVFETNLSGISARDMYESMVRLSKRHAILRTVVVPLTKDTYPFRSVHMILRSLEDLPTTAIKICGPLADSADLKTQRQAILSFGGDRRPALQACIVPLTKTGTLGLCMSVHHGVFDALSMANVFKDLEVLLCGQTLEHESLVPYLTFAESYRVHKEGALGKRTAQYHADKFVSSGISAPDLWPPLKGPGCFIGPDDEWKYADGSRGQASLRVGSDNVAGIPRGHAIHSRAFVLGLATLKASQAIEPSTVFKAAVALFNARETGQCRAVFKTTSAGRVWPFLEPWLAHRLPHPVGIDGPCLSWTIDGIQVDHDQPALEFLHDVQEAEQRDRIHPHAPWLSIRNQLEGPAQEMFDQIAVRQTFNWDPSTKARAAVAADDSSKPVLKPLARQGFIDVAFLWNFGLVNEDEVAGFVLYDDVHLSQPQASAAMASVFRIAQWLANEANWGKTLSQWLIHKGKLSASPFVSDRK